MIVPSLTFIASVHVIRQVGATPVFAEINARTWNVDPEDVARKITPRTKAIMAVDQLGLPCDIDAINALGARHGIHVLEDAACSFGSRNRGRPVGAFCEATVFSLHARKVITTGEGGVIVTNDASLAEHLRRLRHQGASLSDFARHNASPTTFERYPEVGYNFRFTDIQAALGLAQLDRIDDILARRRRVAETYLAYLAGHLYLTAPFVPEGMTQNWQTFQIGVKQESPLTRNESMDGLYPLGIPTRRGVMASHAEEAYRDVSLPLPVTEWAAANTLQLPMHPELTVEQQQAVIEALDKTLTSAAARRQAS